MKLELYYPIKPYKSNQDWGIHRPEVYGQFGFTKHNGIDLDTHDSNKMVYAPINGTVGTTGNQPRGGGLYIVMIADDEFDWEDGKRSKLYMSFLHMKNFNVTPGQHVVVGDLLGESDNTGFSTGPHTHFSTKRVIATPTGYVDMDKNDANNTFDQAPYFNGKYALDEARIKILKQLISLYQQVISMLKK